MLRNVQPELRRPIGKLLTELAQRNHISAVDLRHFASYVAAHSGPDLRLAVLKYKDAFSETEFERVARRIRGVIDTTPKTNGDRRESGAKNSSSPVRKPPLRVLTPSPSDMTAYCICPRKCPKPAARPAGGKSYRRSSTKPAPPATTPLMKSKNNNSANKRRGTLGHATPFHSPRQNSVVHKSEDSQARKQPNLSTSEEREVAKCTFRPNLEVSKKTALYRHIESKLRRLLTINTAESPKQASAETVASARATSRRRADSKCEIRKVSVYDTETPKKLRNLLKHGYSFTFEEKRARRKQQDSAKNASLVLRIRVVDKTRKKREQDNPQIAVTNLDGCLSPGSLSARLNSL